MAQDAKTIVPKRSIGGFSMLSWGSRSRNITPPSGVTLNPDDLHTPPGQISKAQSDPSPDSTQGLLTPPEARQRDIFVTPFSLEGITDEPFNKGIAIATKSPDEVLTYDQFGFTRNITGADWSQPIFDGRSQNPKDHFIELNDSSMERIPDVRAYFWAVGESLDKQKTRPAHQQTPAEARIYDEKVVREGREHIKKCRDEGLGFYLNENQDFASYNQPGQPWYRMPAFGMVESIVKGRLKYRQGYFEYRDRDLMREHCMEEGVILTNIRVPILWAEYRSPTHQPGIARWDVHVMSTYNVHSPVIALAQGQGWEDIMDLYFIGITSPERDGFIAADLDVVNAMIDQEWPKQRPPSPTYEAAPMSMLDMTYGGTPKDFFKDNDEDDMGNQKSQAKGKGSGKGKNKVLGKLGKTFGKSK